ncbi:MAG: DUF1269 domain-containing protein [Chloroflexota bacterium]|nr:MAG: DUF1269 domain-containing protein [Chloroflexota bacterium]
MNDGPVQLLIVAFDEEKAADSAVKELKSARKQGQVEFDQVAVVRRDEKGRLHVRETGDPSSGKGALAGGLTGAVLGALAGPAGIVAGGVVGAFAGAGMAAPDTGIPDERLAEIGRALGSGTSAVIVLSDEENLDPLRRQLEPGAAELFTVLVDSNIGDQLIAAQNDPNASDPDESPDSINS